MDKELPEYPRLPEFSERPGKDKYLFSNDERAKSVYEVLLRKLDRYKNEVNGITGNLHDRIDTIKEEMKEFFGDWVDDGTLGDIINRELLGDINNKVDGVTAQLAQIVHLMPEPNGLDDTKNIKDFFALGHKNVKFQKGVYNISLDGSNHRNSLAWFIGTKGVKIIGEGTTIIDNTVYTKDKLVNIFAFTRCEDILIDGIEYIGVAVDNPDDNLNTTGGTFAYFEDNCKNITVNLKGNNLRYGVRSGDYLNTSYGQCKNFHLNITGNMIGYPVCIYYGDNVNSYVEVDGFHRGHYLAGVWGGNIVSKCKNIYGEITHVLLTNTITLWHDSDINLRKTRATKNLKIFATDNNSTKMHDNTLLVQIALAWVSPGSNFDNIDVDFHVKSTNGISDKVGGFAIQSAVKAQRPEYPYNFEPHVSFKDIKVKGLIDRAGQTTSTNALGELFIRMYDPDDLSFTHLPTVGKIEFEVTYTKGSVQTRNFYIDSPNSENIILSNCDFSGINISTSSKKVTLRNSKLGNLSAYKSIDELSIENSVIASIDVKKIPLITQVNTQILPFISKNSIRRVNVYVNGESSIVVPSFFKRGGMVKSVMAQISRYSTVGVWSLGVPSSLNYFGVANLSSSSGYNRFSPINYPINTLPKMFTVDTDLVVTFTPNDSTTFPFETLQLFIEEDIYSVN